MWASLGRYGQRWAKAGKSGWVRLIGQGWGIYLVDGSVYTCRSRGGCGWGVWVSLSMYG